MMNFAEDQRMHGTLDAMEEARRHAYSIPIDQVDPSHPELFRKDTFWPYFDRLRKEDPVHHCVSEFFGPYWSVTKYNDIMVAMAYATRHPQHASKLILVSTTTQRTAAEPLM